ncbi:MAG: hypothetical protein HFI67_09555 [Lachnospiraceae bacterium]|jgi:hypothetical protein|nr:hypothetical protein [Lachnospiraceae bacterium]
MDKNKDRESRKRKLRAGVIDSRTGLRDEEVQEVRQAGRRRKRQIWLAAAAVLAVLAAAGVLGFRMYQNGRQYTEATVLWEKEMAADASSGYETYGENLLRYTRDGVSYLNRKGEEIWNQAFEMKSPFAAVRGDYAVIADRNGYAIYICDKTGCRGMVSTALPISKVSVSSTGVTVAILEDTKSNVIAFYDKTGKKLQIEVQTTLAGNGYPIDLDISPNGMLLMVSYIYLDEGLMQNQVVFYNFDDEGQSVKDRLVGGFKEYEDSIVARVRFLDNLNACAFAQDRLCFYSLEHTVQPELMEQVDINGEIECICYSENYAGIIVSESGGPKKLFLYGASGKEMFSEEIGMGYDHMEVSGSYVLLYNDAECRIYSTSGKLKYEGTLPGGTDKLLSLGERRYIQVGPQVIRELELK